MASKRAVIFQNDCIYHLFNRGVERRPIFFTPRDYKRFMSLLEYYRFHEIAKSYSHFLRLSLIEQIVFRQSLESKTTAIDILAFCLMPNHYHIIVKQNVDRGIHSFLSNVTNGYTKYLNTKRERVGPLYQGPFKAVYIETDEQLLHLSRYVHINPTVSNVVTLNALSSYPWSSFPDYLDNSAKSFINTSKILSHFKTNQEYKDFVYDHISYAEQLEKIKHLAMEEV